MARPVDETGETDPGTPPPVPGSPRNWLLELPFQTPPLTFNQLQGKHWSVAHRAKASLHEAAFYLSRAAEMPRPIAGPVTIELIYWPGNNSVHDSDNMMPTLKYLVDGLRKAGVLVDDRGRYVRSTMCTIIERDQDSAQRTDARMALVVRAL